ncbi:MAG: hypothetical protein ACQEWD_04440 [Bacteroidota bacterium]
MGLKPLKNFFEENKFISILILISLVSALRNLFLPLTGDETTYVKIAENILNSGQYFHSIKPSTVTPSLPFLITLFYTKFDPSIGFALSKLANLSFVLIGLHYLYKFLNNLNLNQLVIPVIVLLTIVNSNFVLWSTLLYPESILFCFFWVFIYYLSKSKIVLRDILILCASFLILTITRYVFAVLGILIVLKLYPFIRDSIRSNQYKSITKLAFYLILMFIPILIWFKYVYYIESENDIGLGYFNRFKDREPFYNIKAGLGLIKHEGVYNLNGIPAFISLFVPMISFRNWILSIILIVLFCWGYLINLKNDFIKNLFVAILLVMLGLIFAGTGFSRYWLPMLPGYLLGFYLFYRSLGLKDSHFIFLSKIVAVIFVVNELRLDYLIFSKI